MFQTYLIFSKLSDILTLTQTEEMKLNKESRDNSSSIEDLPKNFHSSFLLLPQAKRDSLKSRGRESNTLHLNYHIHKKRVLDLEHCIPLQINSSEEILEIADRKSDTIDPSQDFEFKGIGHYVKTQMCQKKLKSPFVKESRSRNTHSYTAGPEPMDLQMRPFEHLHKTEFEYQDQFLSKYHLEGIGGNMRVNRAKSESIGIELLFQSRIETQNLMGPADEIFFLLKICNLIRNNPNYDKGGVFSKNMLLPDGFCSLIYSQDTWSQRKIQEKSLQSSGSLQYVGRKSQMDLDAGIPGADSTLLSAGEQRKFLENQGRGEGPFMSRNVSDYPETVDELFEMVNQIGFSEFSFNLIEIIVEKREKRLLSLKRFSDLVRKYGLGLDRKQMNRLKEFELMRNLEDMSSWEDLNQKKNLDIQEWIVNLCFFLDLFKSSSSDDKKFFDYVASLFTKSNFFR